MTTKNIKKVLLYIWNNARRYLQFIYLRNPIRRYRIKRAQQKFLEKQDCAAFEKLVVFFVPGYDIVNGGVMSIAFLAQETHKTYANRDNGVFVCPMPRDPPLIKFTKFDNDLTLVDFRSLISQCRKVKKILLHVPECYVDRLVSQLDDIVAQNTKTQYHFNIMFQNIDLAPRADQVDILKAYGPVTITTAHKAYSGIETQQRYGCPVHHMSSWGSSFNYEHLNFHDKRKLIILSPDGHPMRDVICKKIIHQLKDYQFVVIKNMTYRKFKKLAAEAQYSLTFGEGLDGYFLEAIYAGGIGITVYNNRFFDSEYQQLPFIYNSWDELSARFADDVCRTNAHPQEYIAIHKKQYDLLKRHYSREICLANLVSYYDNYFAL